MDQAVPSLDGSREWTASWSLADSWHQASQPSFHHRPGKRSFSLRPIGSCRAAAAVHLPPASQLWGPETELSEVEDRAVPLAERDLGPTFPTADLWSWGNVVSLGDPCLESFQRKSRKTRHNDAESSFLFGSLSPWDEVTSSAQDLCASHEEEFSFPVLDIPSERKLRRSDSFSEWADGPLSSWKKCDSQDSVDFEFPDPRMFSSCDMPSNFIRSIR